VKTLLLVISTVFLLASMSPPVSAQGASADKKPEKAKHKEMKRRGEKESDALIERAEEEHQAARERAEEASERAEAAQGDNSRGGDNAVSKGSDKAQEMRARRDERKEIKEGYQEGREPGSDDVESDLEDKVEEKPEKKPWWKFWSD